jgi:rod shape-determining protein MreC
MHDRTIRRRRAVLALLVVSSLILVTAYFGESASSPLHSVQRGIMSVVSPIQEGASRALKPFRDLFGWVGDTVSAKGELKDARKERDAWQAKAISMEAQARQNREFRGLLGLNDSPSDVSRYAPVTARVIGRSSVLWYIQLVIDKGSTSGIRADQPVVASDGTGNGAGLIGKVQTAANGLSASATS